MPSYAEVARVNGRPHSTASSETANDAGDYHDTTVDDAPQRKPYSTGIVDVPVTLERVPYIPQEGDALIDAGTARATIAASKESPNGTQDGQWANRYQHLTVLQQHCAYWDPDGDGVIWPIDTYNGCRRYGWGVVLSLVATLIINIGLSYPTVPGWLPDPFFRIWLANIHKAKHGSDSMTFDNEGRFKPQQFEDFFSKYDRGGKGGLDKGDLVRAVYAQRLAFDFFGWTAVSVEWLATYLLLWPEDGILRKEDCRRVYDGSIFQAKADEYAERQKKNRKQQ